MCDDKLRPKEARMRAFSTETVLPRTLGCPRFKSKIARHASFKLFSTQQKARLTALYPFLTPEQINRKVSTLWSKFSPAEKKNFGSGDFSLTCLTPKRISKISVLCTPRLTTTKRLKKENLLEKTKSAMRAYDFDFTSPEIQTKPAFLMGRTAGADISGVRPQIDNNQTELSSSTCTSDIRDVNLECKEMKNKVNSKDQMWRRTQQSAPNTRMRLSPKLSHTADIEELDLSEKICKGPLSKSSDFEAIEKENPFVESAKDHAPFQPKLGELTYKGMTGRRTTTAPEVVDDTPSERPGILRKSARKHNVRRVSFNETDLQSVTFQQELSQESNGNHMINNDGNESADSKGKGLQIGEVVVENVSLASEVVCGDNGLKDNGIVLENNEMMKRAAFYAHLMADEYDIPDERNLDETAADGKSGHHLERVEAVSNKKSRRGRINRSRACRQRRGCARVTQCKTLGKTRGRPGSDNRKGKSRGTRCQKRNTVGARARTRVKKSLRSRQKIDEVLLCTQLKEESEDTGKLTTNDMSVYDLSESETDEHIVENGCESFSSTERAYSIVELKLREKADFEADCAEVVVDADGDDENKRPDRSLVEERDDLENYSRAVSPQCCDIRRQEDGNLIGPALERNAECGKEGQLVNLSLSQSGLLKKTGNRQREDTDGRMSENIEMMHKSEASNDQSGQGEGIKIMIDADVPFRQTRTQQKKKRRAVGCEQVIDDGIEKIGSEVCSVHQERNIGYDLRKRSPKDTSNRIEVNGIGIPTKKRQRKHTDSGDMFQATHTIRTNKSKVVIVAEIHAVVDHKVPKDRESEATDASTKTRGRELAVIETDIETQANGMDSLMKERENSPTPLDGTVREDSGTLVEENALEKNCEIIKLKGDSQDGGLTGGGDASREFNKRAQTALSPGKDMDDDVKDAETSDLGQPRCIKRRPRQGMMQQNEHLSGVEASDKSSKDQDGDSYPNACIPQVLPTYFASTSHQDSELLEATTPVTDARPAHLKKEELETPMGTVVLTSGHSKECELVTPMTDVRLIEEINNQVQMAPKKSRNDANGGSLVQMMTPACIKEPELDGLEDKTSGCHEEIDLEKSVQSTVGTDLSCPKDGNQGYQADISTEVLGDTVQTARDDESGSEESGSEQTETCAPETSYEVEQHSTSDIPKEERKALHPSSEISHSEPSDSSSIPIPSEHLDQVFLELDPTEISESSPPPELDEKSLKPRSSFNVSQAIQKMQMIGSFSPISGLSPLSSTLSPSLSGVSQLSTISSVPTHKDVSEDIDFPSTRQKEDDYKIHSEMEGDSDTHGWPGTGQEQPSQKAVPVKVQVQSGCSGFCQGETSPSRKDGDLCEMFQEMTPPQSVMKSGRRLIASNKIEGTSLSGGLFEDEDIFL